jgi:hypothetical protein
VVAFCECDVLPIFEDGLAESYFEEGGFARKGTWRKEDAKTKIRDGWRDCGCVYAGRSEPRQYKGERRGQQREDLAEMGRSVLRPYNRVVMP